MPVWGKRLTLILSGGVAFFALLYLLTYWDYLNGPYHKFLREQQDKGDFKEWQRKRDVVK